MDAAALRNANVETARSDGRPAVRSRPLQVSDVDYTPTPDGERHVPSVPLERAFVTEIRSDKLSRYTGAGGADA
jgi:hypothetical protein